MKWTHARIISNTSYLTTSTGYVAVPEQSPFLYDSSKYTNPSFRLLIRGYISNSSGTASFILLSSDGDAITDTMTEVTGSQITTASATAVHLESSDVTLTNGKRYWVGMKTSNSSYTTYFHAAALAVVDDLGSSWPTVVETYAVIGAADYRSFSTYGEGGESVLYKHDASKFDPAPSVYIDGTFSNDTGTGYARLYKISGTPEAVSGSEISFTSSTRTRYRSGSFSLEDGATYVLQLKSTSGTAYTRYPHLCFIQSGTITKTRLFHPLSSYYLLASSSWSFPYQCTYKHLDSELGTSQIYLYWTVDSRGGSTEFDTALYNSTDSTNTSTYSEVVNTTYKTYCEPINSLIENDHKYKMSYRRIAGPMTSIWTGASVVFDYTVSPLKANYDMSTTTGSLLQDMSDNGNHGTGRGGVTFGGVAGISGNCTSFDGNDDFVDLGNGSTITTIGTNKLSLAAYINLDTLNTISPILSSDIYSLHISTAGQVVFKLVLGGTTYTKTFGSTGAISTGRWYHIAVTFDGNSWNCYINNVAQTPQTQSGTLSSTTNPVYLGRN